MTSLLTIGCMGMMIAAASRRCVDTRVLVQDGVPVHASPRDVMVPEEKLRFFVIGDFGVDTKSNSGPDWRSDFDVPKRDAVAAAMKNTTESDTLPPPHFVVNVGDSFYQDGIRSTQDERWETTWSKAFPEPEVPWYSALGNHDWYGNGPSDTVGTFTQINYTTVDPTDRWCLPDFNYSFSVRTQSGRHLAKFIVIDTQSLLQSRSGGCRGDNLTVDTSREYCQGYVPPPREQLAWLEEEACGSDADWTIAVGHIPLVSSGDRLRTFDPSVTQDFINSLPVTDAVKQTLTSKFLYDPTEKYKADVMFTLLEPIFKRCKVNAYVTGHEHMTQVLEYQEGGWSLPQLGFGDSGKDNLCVGDLVTEPMATACRITDQCYASQDTLRKAWSDRWSLYFKDCSGAFADVRLTPRFLHVDAVGPEGVIFSRTFGSSSSPDHPPPMCSSDDRLPNAVSYSFITAFFLMSIVSACLYYRLLSMSPRRTVLDEHAALQF